MGQQVEVNCQLCRMGPRLSATSRARTHQLRNRLPNMPFAPFHVKKILNVAAHATANHSLSPPRHQKNHPCPAPPPTRQAYRDNSQSLIAHPCPQLTHYQYLKSYHSLTIVQKVSYFVALCRAARQNSKKCSLLFIFVHSGEDDSTSIRPSALPSAKLLANRKPP
jgi:hypothetical protein